VNADFSLNEQQLELQRSARRLFAETESLARAREDETTEAGFQTDLWRRMAELGWLGMALSTAVRGGGGSFLDGYALSEEMGQALVTSPFLECLGVAGPLLASEGGDRFEDVLARMVKGTCIVSVMLGDRLGRIDRSDVRANRDGGGWQLNGSAPLVAFASSADYFVTAARATLGGAPALSLYLVDATSPGITLERVENIAALPLYQVQLSDVTVGDTALIGEPGRGWESLYPTLTKAAVLQTAYIVGAAHSVLEMTNQYAKDRWQFGIPIGKNQAVQYMVSDVLIDMHTTDLLGRQAAYLIDAGRAYETAAEIAIVHGKSQAAHLHRQAHEVFAGIGFMREHPLNLFSRKSKYLESNLGDVRFHYEQVARLICDDRDGARA
jgi:3-oxocholest-4-en-26-oyl-CoA dehydrogenase beta subunit